jgi:hypothetical protein
MPSDFPLWPKVQKGALAVYERDEQSAQAQIIVFQYNPDQLKRTLANRAPQSPPSNAGGAKEDVLRVGGPPVENINLTVALNAIDQPAGPATNGVTNLLPRHGLHPALATLEMLLYPPTLRVQNNQQLAKGGAVQISSEKLPLTLLVWGESRVVPITLTNFTVTEEAFDPNLNPIQAKVELAMRVLTYMELKETGLGRNAFLAYQRQKETHARAYAAGGDTKGITGFVQRAVTRPGAG